MKSLVDYFMIKFMEELNETGQAVSKVLTFGIDDVNPHTTHKNRINVLHEMIDVHVIIYLLTKFGVRFHIGPLFITDPDQKLYFHKKIIKVLHYTRISNSLDKVMITEEELAIISNLELISSDEIKQM